MTQPMQHMINVASQLSVDELKQEIVKNFIDVTAEGLVFAALLGALEKKMTEVDYIAFLDSLDL